MSPAPLTTVVFDVGNVLYDWQPEALYRTLIADEEERAWFLTEVCSFDWHCQHDAGHPFAETSAELIARFPEHEANIRAWGERFGETLVGALPGMTAIVEALDAGGVPLFAITNFSDEFWQPFRAREAALFDRLRGILVSGAERLVKPDAPIYALAIDRFGLDPAACLFVDDRADNVAAAEAAGMAGHLFDGAAGLRDRLVREGLLA